MKNKKLTAKIVAILAIATVLSCCFLGSTMAKYTSSTTGTASTGVALWQVTGVSDKAATEKFELTASELSPAIDGNANTVTTGIYKIENKSEVAAKITIAQDTEGWTATANDGITLTDTIKGYVTAAFSISFLQATTEDGNYTDIGEDGVTLTAKTGVVYLKAVITWTTVSDEQDTAIGMNVASVSTGVTITATQASVLPANA